MNMTSEEQLGRLEVSVREALKILEEDGQFARLDAQRVLRSALDKSAVRTTMRLKEMK